MRVGVIGLAYSHPYTYGSILRRMGHQVSHVWDTDRSKAGEFAEQHGARVVDAPHWMLGEGLDGVIVTSPGGEERTGYALACIERDIPTYVGKPLATNLDDLVLIGSTARQRDCPVMSASVLRYAPAVEAVRRRVAAGKAGTVLAARATAVHAIARYLEDPHRWQDDPALGGGTIVSMGVHALDPLVAVLGGAVESVFCVADRRHHRASASEDVALLTMRWKDGPLVAAEIVGGFAGEYYGLEVFGNEGIFRVQVPKSDVVNHLGAGLGDLDPCVEFGYVGSMEQFAAMCETRQMPIALEETEAIMRVLIAARRSVVERREITLAEVP